jgi:hypothetical protein
MTTKLTDGILYRMRWTSRVRRVYPSSIQGIHNYPRGYFDEFPRIEDLDPERRITVLQYHIDRLQRNLIYNPSNRHNRETLAQFRQDLAQAQLELQVVFPVPSPLQEGDKVTTPQGYLATFRYRDWTHAFITLDDWTMAGWWSIGQLTLVQQFTLEEQTE